MRVFLLGVLVVIGAKSVKAEGECHDVMVNGVNWHETGSTKYDCKWYAGRESRCSEYGDNNPWGGFTAKKACCLCGGGATDTQCSDLTLVNGEPWHDEGGKSTDCKWYAGKRKRCNKYGDKYPFDGLTANDACCTCGGGEIVEQEAPEPLKLHSVSAKVRLFNFTVEELTQSKAIGLIQALSSALTVPMQNLNVSKYEDYDVPDPWARKGNAMSLINLTKSGPAARHRRKAWAQQQPNKARTAVDMTFTAKVANLETFKTRFDRAIQKRTLKAKFRKVMPSLSRVSSPFGLEAVDVACFENCNRGRAFEEYGEKCYCSQVCIEFGDCCPSFFDLKCLPPDWVTFSPTPSGPGDHWLARNQQWNMLDPNSDLGRR
jgi:hypothetical protein